MNKTYKCPSCRRTVMRRGYCSRCQTEYQSYMIAMMGVGYKPIAGVPPEDCLDFIGKVLTREEIKSGLNMGVMPPGLILENKRMRAVVVGDYDTHQRLVKEADYTGQPEGG